MKEEKYNQYHRDTKYNENTMKITCQQIGQPRRNGQISRNTQLSKTESGGNKQSEQSSH